MEVWGIFLSVIKRMSEAGPLESCKEEERCRTRWDMGALKHHQCSFSQLLQPGAPSLHKVLATHSCSASSPAAAHASCRDECLLPSILMGVHCNLTGPYGIFNVKMAFRDIFFFFLITCSSLLAFAYMVFVCVRGSSLCSRSQVET